MHWMENFCSLINGFYERYWKMFLLYGMYNTVNYSVRFLSLFKQFTIIPRYLETAQTRRLDLITSS